MIKVLSLENVPFIYVFSLYYANKAYEAFLLIFQSFLQPNWDILFVSVRSHFPLILHFVYSLLFFLPISSSNQSHQHLWLSFNFEKYSMKLEQTYFISAENTLLLYRLISLSVDFNYLFDDHCDLGYVQ